MNGDEEEENQLATEPQMISCAPRRLKNLRRIFTFHDDNTRFFYRSQTPRTDGNQLAVKPYNGTSYCTHRTPMHSSHIHLPTEIVVLIVSFVACDADDARRQRSMYACCLLSNQWYSAAIACLYERPRLERGLSFKKFTDTVCPPIAARKSKMNLGSLVRRLDLSGLVHHSSNSLTARLLGKVHANLEVFIAPSVSFAVNSLAALAKCHNLRYLDLSLVGESMPFASLAKAVSSLTKLTTLRLPRTTNITELQAQSQSQFQTQPTINWPPHLARLQVSGQFSSTLISSFPWPLSLTTLALKNCTDLSVNPTGCLVSSPHLSRCLTSLTISGFNRNLQPESINAIPAFLPDLTFLSVPGDLVQESFFDMLSYHTNSPLALEVLEFGHPFMDASLGFSTEVLLQALGSGLNNLKAVGFAEAYLTEQRILDDEEIENALYDRAKDRQKMLGEGYDDEDIGVYYL